MLRYLTLLLLFCSCQAKSPIVSLAPTKKSSQPRIAITIDDLPWVGTLAPGDDKTSATKRLLQVLREYQVPAFGFVTCGRIKDGDEEVLHLWQQAGFELGNHSTAHQAIDHLTLDAWFEDVSACHQKLRELTKEPVRYFRYPFLRMGKTFELRDAGLQRLTALQYQIGHVSVDTSDWLLNTAYEDALRANDQERAREVATAYQAHMLAAVHHYQEVAKQKQGRDIQHILLLHANAIEADHLSEVLAALQAEGFQFISLEEALKDPVYREKDEYAGAWGVSWLNRLAPRQPDVAYWDKEQIQKISQQFGIK
jgi:peptidoglycan/xylan/chitin deacetylase (PgdA/CDA1 family)